MSHKNLTNVRQNMSVIFRFECVGYKFIKNFIKVCTVIWWLLQFYVSWQVFLVFYQIWQHDEYYVRCNRSKTNACPGL